MKTANHRQDMEQTALLQTERELEAELLALVPRPDRTAAECTLLLLLELHAERRILGEMEP